MPAKNPEWDRWYRRSHWRRLRLLILNRDPVCRYCGVKPSTVVDHIKPHRGDYQLFSDPENLAGCCAPCHDSKTATQDGGWGHPVKPATEVRVKLAPTGTAGKQFEASAIGDSQLDAALGDVDELLKDI